MELLTNFLNNISTHLPGVLGALVVLFVGLIISSGVRRLVIKLLHKTNLDNRLLGSTSTMTKPEEAVGNLVYYLMVLMVLMIVLEMMGVSNVLDPLKNMAGKFLSFVPNVIGAGVIAYVGYILATLVSNLLTLSTSFFDKFTSKVRLPNEINLIGIIRQVVFLFIFIPILIAALDALNISSISEPAKIMLNTLINAVPNIIAATLIITAFYLGGKYISHLLEDILASTNANGLAEKMRMNVMFGESFSLSKFVGGLAFFFIMFGGVVTGIEKLGFGQLTHILNMVMQISGQIVFGLAIMLVGTFASNLIFNALAKGENNQFMASIAKVAAMSLFLAIGLRAMGIADDIVNMAFGLLLGAVAVAIAVAFGIGGRETAGKFWSDFYDRLKK
jgi:hypothetical protein